MREIRQRGEMSSGRRRILENIFLPAQTALHHGGAPQKLRWPGPARPGPRPDPSHMWMINGRRRSCRTWVSARIRNIKRRNVSAETVEPVMNLLASEQGVCTGVHVCFSWLQESTQLITFLRFILLAPANPYSVRLLYNRDVCLTYCILINTSVVPRPGAKYQNPHHGGRVK